MSKRRGRRQGRRRPSQNSNSSSTNTQNAGSLNNAEEDKSRKELVISIVSAIVTTLLTSWILAVVPSISSYLIATLVIVLLGSLAVFLVKNRNRRKILIAVGAACILALGVSYVVTKPSPTEKLVAAYAKGICSDNMWADKSAVCYPAASQYIVKNFAAFDPSGWHGWDELPTSAVNANRLSPDAAPLSASSITTVGEVSEVQQMGGSQLVIQMRPLLSTESASLTENEALKKLFPSEVDRDIVLDTNLKTPKENTNVFYCNLPARPYFAPRRGDILAIKGAILASGSVHSYGEDKLSSLIYVTCSTAERIDSQQ